MVPHGYRGRSLPLPPSSFLQGDRSPYGAVVWLCGVAEPSGAPCLTASLCVSLTIAYEAQAFGRGVLALHPLVKLSPEGDEVFLRRGIRAWEETIPGACNQSFGDCTS